MILRARAQSIRAIGCHHLCVIHRDFLLTSPNVGCCQLVPSFANAIGSLFCSKLLNFISCGLMEALPKIIFVVVVLISTIFFSRVLLPLFHGFSPVYITEHIQKYYSIENFIKLPFQRALIHLNRSPNEGAMAVLFPLLHAVQKISERATFGNSATPACRNLRLT
jgi:hypothetical protein